MAGGLTATLSHAEDAITPTKYPEVLPDDGVWDGMNVNYSGNTTTTKGRLQGGALKVSDLTIRKGSANFDNNSVTVEGSNGYTNGAAVWVNGSFTLDDNSIVSFSNNQMSGSSNKTDEGAALYMHGNTFITNNDTVKFDNNSISTKSAYSTKAYGGAIRVSGSYSTLIISDNTDVSGSGNHITTEANGTSQYHRGAFLYSDGNSIVELSRNTGTLNIKDNYITGKSPLQGGAIYLSLGKSSYEDFTPQFSINDNNIVVISGNYIDSYSTRSVNGGAIYVSGTSADADTAAFQICGNTKVDIVNNAAKGTTARGGGIYVDNLALRIQGNDEVLISGNYEKSSASYTMRSIYAFSNILSNDDNSRSSLILSANEGGYIEMRDGMQLLAKTPVKFNTNYEGKAQTGDIIFTGVYTEENLNAAIAANTAEGASAVKVTEQMLTDSRKFAFQHYFASPNVGPSASQIPDLQAGLTATLEGGRLRVEEQAQYIGMGFEATKNSNSTLRLKNASFEHAFSRNGSYPCTFYYDVTFDSTTTLEAEGTNSITAGNLTMMEDSTMSFVVGSQNITEAIISYIGGDKTTAVTGTDDKGKDIWEVVDANSSLSISGSVTVWVRNVVDDELVRGQRYALLTTSDNVTLAWDDENLTVKGIAKASDISWEDNTLYLTYNRPDLEVATWVDAENNGLWHTESYNWTYEGYLYNNTESVKVIFDDTADNKEVNIVGTHTPSKVEVNNSSGNDYTFTGDGSLSGGMKLVKNGTGSLKIGTSNSYTGGTEVNNGLLIVGNESALGTGNVILHADGALDMASYSISNNVEAEGGTISGADHYVGNLDVCGNLALEGAATAAMLRMKNNARIQGTTLAVNSIDAQGGTAAITADVTVNNDGTITLNNGSILNVTGSLTLSGVTTIKLVGDYGDGDTLVTSTGDLTTGTLNLDYDSAYMLEQVGNSLVLTLRFKQDIADAVGQGNWGIATASRAFVNTVRGQRNNTGCLVNGRGTVWFSALGASNDMELADISVEGAAIGADMKLTERSTMGIAFGYTDGKVSPVGLRKINQDAYYAAVYGEHVLRNRTPRTSWVLDWVMAYGSTESEQGSMSWEQDSLQLNSRLSWNRRVSDRLTVTAFGGLEYFATNSDTVDGVKTGSIQNLRAEIGVGTDYVLWGAPAQVNSKTGQPSSGCDRLVLHGEVSYFNDLMRNNPVIRMNGVSGSSCNPGRHGLGIEAGATYRINDKWTTSANYSFNAMEDSTEHRLNIGASMSF